MSAMKPKKSAQKQISGYFAIQQAVVEPRAALDVCG